jgi:RimJ/RimL family protein N-acetyltransferase
MISKHTRISKRTRKTITNKTKKTHKIQYQKHITKTNTNNNTNSKLYLKSIDTLSNNQLKQLSQITNDKSIMQHIGTGKNWSLKDLHTFANEERLESKVIHPKRTHYTMCLILDNTVIGFIAGRKNKKLLPPNAQPYDLLLRMFISKQHSGKGYGKLIIKLFINKYSNMIKKQKATLYSDISKDNVPSIKIHEANNFKKIDYIKYPNGKFYERYIKLI